MSELTLLGGRYAVDGVLGRGGMAEVRRARDQRLGRDVAVKQLRIDLATDPTFQARFRREAQSGCGAEPSEHRLGVRHRRGARSRVRDARALHRYGARRGPHARGCARAARSCPSGHLSWPRACCRR